MVSVLSSGDFVIKQIGLKLCKVYKHLQTSSPTVSSENTTFHQKFHVFKITNNQLTKNFSSCEQFRNLKINQPRFLYIESDSTLQIL